jgi:hypothetical protein
MMSDLTKQQVTEATHTLQAFTVNEMFAFETSPADLAETCLESAHALTLMLGAAFRDSDETASTNRWIICDAFNGIAKLIALAAFVGEAK